jgi:hypothetical protein
MTDVALLADAVRRVLVLAIAEGGVAPGVAVDIARRIADEAGSRGVELDDLLELASMAEWRRR